MSQENSVETTGLDYFYRLERGLNIFSFHHRSLYGSGLYREERDT